MIALQVTKKMRRREAGIQRGNQPENGGNWLRSLHDIPHEVRQVISFPDEDRLPVSHQHFCRPKPAVIIRSHLEPIGAGIAKHQ